MFPAASSVLEDIALHLGVAAAVAMLVAKATKHLRGGVTLLGRRGLVVQKNLVDDPLERTEFRCEAIPNRWVGLGMVENLPDGDSGEIEFPGDLPDGLAIAVRPPNGAVIVHRKHFLASMRVRHPCKEAHSTGGGWGGSLLDDHIAPRWVTFR